MNIGTSIVTAIAADRSGKASYCQTIVTITQGNYLFTSGISAKDVLLIYLGISMNLRQTTGE